MRIPMRSLSWAAAIVAWSVLAPCRARADLVYTLASDTAHDAATADFRFSGSGIDIVVTNTGLSTETAANAVSEIVITVGGNLSLPTAFTQVSGDVISYGKSVGTGTDLGTQTFKSSDSTLGNSNWQLSTNTGTSQFGLATVAGIGSTSWVQASTKPTHMIVAQDATQQGNSLHSHDPSFNGSATFHLTFSGLPTALSTSNITGVYFSFGTTPEDNYQLGTGSGTTPMAVAAPEPSSLLVAALGAIGFVGYGLRRRKAA